MIELRTKGERLRWVREQLGLSRQEAKQRVGISTSTYSAYERAEQGGSGSRNFSYETAEEIAQRLGVANTAHWIYTGKGPPPEMKSNEETAPKPAQTAQKPKGVPVVGFFGAPTGEGALYGFDSEELPRPCFATATTAALEIKGRSVAEGMFAFFHRDAKPLAREHIGYTCILGCDFNRLLIRRIIADTTGLPAIVPYAENDEQLDKWKINWAARVVAIAPR